MNQEFQTFENTWNDILDSFYWPRPIQRIIVHYIIDDFHLLFRSISDDKILGWYVSLLNINNDNELLNMGIIDACAYGHLQCYILLRSFCPSQAQYNYPYLLAFRFACANGHTEIIKYMQKDLQLNKENFRPSYLTNFVLSCRRGDINVVSCLTECFHITDDDIRSLNNTTFHKATTKFQNNVLPFLINKFPKVFRIIE